MDLKLKLLMITIALIFHAFVYKKVIDNKLQIGHSLIWFFLVIVSIIVTVFDSLLNPIKDFLGFEKISNMIFIFAFFIIIFVLFNAHLKISEQGSKIVKLTQELAILKKELKK